MLLDWLLAIGFLIFILLLIFLIYLYHHQQQPASIPPNVIPSTAVWSKAVPSPNAPENVCQTYQFPVALNPFDGGSSYIIGNPTFNSDILDNLTGSTIIPLCLDPDQIVAQQVTHTCLTPATTSQTSLCPALDGTDVPAGTTETYYSGLGCGTVSACAGTLSLISLDYSVPTPNIEANYCLLNNGPTNNVTVQLCNLLTTAQYFRITRANLGQNPGAVTPGQQNGIFAQILDRTTGLCLGVGSGSVTVNNQYFAGTPCASQAPPPPITGPNVVLQSCPNPDTTVQPLASGFNWLLLEPGLYCGNPGGCLGCSGCSPCTVPAGAQDCTGCSGCGGSIATYIPQQIVYVGDIDFSTFDPGSSANELFSFLVANNAQSLYFGGDPTVGNITLAPLALGTPDPTVPYCPSVLYTAQYIGITEYNVNSNLPACVNNGVEPIANCVSF